jgi:hypothetical protein
MLPDWMIEEINKQEQAQQEQRPRLEIPVPPEDWRPYPEEKREKSNRGVITFNIWGD